MTRTEPNATTPHWPARAADLLTGDGRNENQRWMTGGTVALLVALAAGGLLTRLWLLGDKSLWLDEAYSWRMAHLSLSDMVSRARHEDVHPPGLYALLHFWVSAFGDSETSLRMPSALAAGASFLLVGVVGWRIGGWLLAVLATLLLAANPTSLQYTQDARFYSIMSLLVLATAATQAWFVRRPSVAPIAAYTMCAIAMTYTHNSGLVVVGVQGLVFGWYGCLAWRRGDRPVILIGALVAGGLILTAYAPWIPAIYEQIDRGGAFVPEPSIRLAGATLRGVLGLRHTGSAWFVFAGPLLAATLFGLWRRRHDEFVVCMAAAASVPVVLFILSYLVSPAFDTKRVSSFVPAIALISAVGMLEAFHAARAFDASRRLAVPTVAAVFAIIVAAMSFGIRDWYDAPPYEDWRTAAGDLARTSGPIYHFPGYLDDPLAYYLDDAGEARLHPLSYRVVDGSLTGIDDTRTASAHLVISHATPEEEAGILEELVPYFDASAPREYTDSIRVYSLAPAADEQGVNR